MDFDICRDLYRLPYPISIQIRYYQTGFRSDMIMKLLLKHVFLLKLTVITACVTGSLRLLNVKRTTCMADTILQLPNYSNETVSKFY